MNKKILINKRMISEQSPVYFVAEIGFNFLNDLNLAFEMINAAKESGANAVKFQSFIADKLVLKSSGSYKILKENELSKESHFKLKEHCDKIGIDFFTTPFDIDTLKFIIYELKVSAIKIASGDLTYDQLLVESAKSGLPIILSTGLATYSEIKKAVRLIKKENENLILLHCVSNYPLQIENSNLNVITKLKKEFKTIVGFSDHSIGFFLPAAATALGAKIIEKHFTINKNLPEADNSISTTPSEFKQMIEEIRKLEFALGSAENKPSKSEQEIKILARRSIYANQDIKKDEIITENKIKIIRPYNSGSEISNIKKIINKQAKKGYIKDDLILTD